MIILCLPGFIRKDYIMTYENFIIDIRDRVEVLCPTDVVRIQKVTKNNGTVKEAIVIHQKGDSVSPTIYLRDFYCENLNGKDLDVIASEIVRICEKGRGSISFDYDACRSFLGVKDRVLCKLINAKRNKELLKKCPHRRILDLALVYYCAEYDSDGCFGSWVINDGIFDEWNVSEDELYRTSLKNLKHMLEPCIETISDVVKGFMPEEMYEEFEIPMDDMKMYVLSNQSRIFGATSIMCGSVLRKFGEEHGDFYILPSSIHEVILLPKDEVCDPGRLEPMVKEVNMNEVRPEEYLSDRVYRYSVDEQEIVYLKN